MVKVDLVVMQAIVDVSSERALSKEEQKVLQDAQQIIARYALPPNDETSAAILGEESEASPKKKGPSKRNGRHPREAFVNAKTVKVSHLEFQPGQPCPCGCGKVYPLKRAIQFRHFVGQVPIEVTLYEMEQVRCNACGQVFTAPLPQGVGPEPYDATAVSTIALSKYGMGLPFYRQAAFLGALGTVIAASTQYEVVAAAVRKIEPAYNHMVEVAAQGKVGYFDDTSVKILDFVRDEWDERTGLFTTGIVSVQEAFQIALYFTGRDHAGENRAKLLKKRDPSLPGMIQMSDALSSNFSEIDSANELIACCLTHGRRNFVKIIDSFPADCRHVIRTIANVYHYDSLSKERGDSPEERLAFHRENSQPIMDELKAWLDSQIVDKKVEPNSQLGKAIQYMRNHWEPLTLFLRVPDAPLDSNTVERALKRVVLHRKNSLFYRSAKGAKTGDIYMSLIQTCQLNGVNPFDYLTALQRNSVAVEADPGDWMPWTFVVTLGVRSASPVP